MLTISISCGDPAALFRHFAAEPWAMLLDSAAPHPLHGRHAYIVAEPVRTIEAVGSQVMLDGAPVGGDPFDLLATALAAWPAPPGGPVPFTGGAVGLIGYEAGTALEGIRSRHRNPGGQPDMAIGLYDVVAAFDRQERRAWVIAARPEAEARARRMAERLSVAPPDPSAGPSPIRWRSELARPDYLARVGRVLEYIRAGDIYQANFTQRFLAEADARADAYALYERLRRLSPAPFAAFLNCGPRLQVVGASPERFIRLGADRRIETRPIKGTRPRHADPAADAAAAAELVASVKDRAENLMITDLLRNDLARVAEIGSVKVPVLYGLESFASVHHLVSVVTARLRPGLGPVDLLRAACPGGSITGAPKIRAMEIIDELEVARRGAYCGSVVWIGFDGAMDSNIVIRTLSVTPDAVIAQAGGGIVADSDPAAEYDEMRIKIRPQLLAVGDLPAGGSAGEGRA
ncbi:aminodeoxychorismate synthase component I [Azospirillum picis]|uniref:aminodeoxychorismate synthase n=1 Tax=Azospirillum picis TaxID=488438 RepID=A0ABU0MI18_9PROT|nr:aminodeoxychorismate synthase component I [Azospirillum picis]MBP2299262.1 para-aminobenzoate synthetase component 1 [Azospirillum picis]MDQ0533100.1 para-aminobenzoate synthetase component 1 [Azospirillum picis]